MRVADLRMFLAGQAVSLLGTWMQSTAQAWLVWRLTHSTSALGTVALFTYLPFLLLAPAAGTWVDRGDRRKLLVRLQIVGMVVAAGLAVLVQTGAIEVWHLYLSASVLGTVATLEMAARPVLLGDLAGPEHVRRAIALNSSMTQASRMIGPALAGIAIGAFGIPSAFWINAASFLAVIFSLLAVGSAPSTDRREGAAASAAGSHGFRGALRFLRTTPGLRELIAFSAMLTFFGMSAANFYPAVADQVLHGDAATLGEMMGASGAGALVGALLGVPLVHNVKRVGLLAGGATLWAGTFLALFSVSVWLPVSVACLFLGGLASPVIITTTVGMLQLLGPKAMRARLQSALLMVTFGIQPIAALATGWSAGVLGVAAALRVNALLMIAAAAVLLVANSSLRHWRPETVVPSPKPSSAPMPVPTAPSPTNQENDNYDSH